jgi:hypothetical protein
MTPFDAAAPWYGAILPEAAVGFVNQITNRVWFASAADSGTY